MTDQNFNVELPFWNKFCARLIDAQATLQSDLAPQSAFDQAEGSRYLSRLIRLGLEIYLEGGDPDFPTFVKPSHETAKLGGDNPDNLYLSATINGDRAYRLTGNIGTVTFFSIASKANRYAIDGTMMSTGELAKDDIKLDKNGNFEIIVSQHRPEQASTWLSLAADSNIVQVRQTFIDRFHEIPATVQIERINEEPKMPFPLDPVTLESRMMAAADFVCNSSRLFVEWAQLFMTSPNEMRDWGQEMFQKAGGDPSIFYVHGYWTLEPDEMLVIETQIPECEHWNIQVNNWWMESLDYRYLPVNINKGTVKKNADGSATIILAHRNPGQPNWLTTDGHEQGFLLLRWVRSNDNPIPTIRKIKLD